MLALLAAEKGSPEVQGTCSVALQQAAPDATADAPAAEAGMWSACLLALGYSNQPEHPAHSANGSGGLTLHHRPCSDPPKSCNNPWQRLYQAASTKSWKHSLSVQAPAAGKGKAKGPGKGPPGKAPGKTAPAAPAVTEARRLSWFAVREPLSKACNSTTGCWRDPGPGFSNAFTSVGSQLHASNVGAGTKSQLVVDLFLCSCGGGGWGRGGGGGVFMMSWIQTLS